MSYLFPQRTFVIWNFLTTIFKESRPSFFFRSCLLEVILKPSPVENPPKQSKPSASHWNHGLLPWFLFGFLRKMTMIPLWICILAEWLEQVFPQKWSKRHVATCEEKKWLVWINVFRGFVLLPFHPSKPTAAQQRIPYFVEARNSKVDKKHEKKARRINKEIIILGGGFKDFLFSPLVGEDFQFDQYFSDGLKPPTRIASIFQSIIMLFGWLAVGFRRFRRFSPTYWGKSRNLHQQMVGFIGILGSTTW